MKEIDRLLDEIPAQNKRNIEFLFKFLAQLTVEEVKSASNHAFQLLQRSIKWMWMLSQMDVAPCGADKVNRLSSGDQQDVDLKSDSGAGT